MKALPLLGEKVAPGVGEVKMIAEENLERLAPSEGPDSNKRSHLLPEVAYVPLAPEEVLERKKALEAHAFLPDLALRINPDTSFGGYEYREDDLVSAQVVDLVKDVPTHY